MEKSALKNQFILPTSRTYNMFTSSAKNCEYDKQIKNSHIANKLHKGTIMSEENYRYIEKKQNGTSITFEFPTKTKDNTVIKAEVKDILLQVLKEYLKSISWHSGEQLETTPIACPNQKGGTNQ